MVLMQEETALWESENIFRSVASSAIFTILLEGNLLCSQRDISAWN